MNKGLQALFGDLTEEEEKAIKATTEDIEKSVLRFQKRPKYEQATHTERGKE